MNRKFHRTVILFVAVTLLISSISPIAFASTPDYAPSYHLYDAFMRNSYPEICNGKRMYLMTLEESENKNYLFFINQGWLMDKASWILDKDLDKDRCIEVLSNIVTMVNYQLEDSITMQASENTKKQIIDFALDSVGVITGLVGMDEAFKDASNAIIRSIPTVTGIAADTLDLAVDSIEELELLNQLLGDYTLQYDFLSAVSTYSDHEPMQEAAQTLLHTNEQILLHKLETFANVSDATAEFLAKDIFIDKVAEEMLKDPTNFSGESTMFAASVAVGAWKTVGAAKLAFDFTMLIGDGLFGTSNQYQQYNEMKAMRDIRGAIIEYIDNHAVTVESDLQGMSKNISLLKTLQYVDAWGETCLYVGIKSDGTFYGDLWPRDLTTVEKNYQIMLDFLSSRVELLESIYIDMSPVVDNAPPEIITEEERVESLYDSVGSITGGHCKWLAEGDFDDDGTNEIYAYISPKQDDKSEGEIWYLSDDEDYRIFWLTDGECTFFLTVFDIFSDSVSVNIINLIDSIDEMLSRI